jgi:RHS repeat-associated protein
MTERPQPMKAKQRTMTFSLHPRSPLGRLARVLADPLAIAIAFNSVPVWAGPGPEAGRAAVPQPVVPTATAESQAPVPAPLPAPSPPIRPNRTRPQVTPPPAYALFSDEPTPQDLFRARVFGEPLVPVGGDPSPAETRELARAIEAFQKAGDIEKTEPFEEFLREHPASAWRASLLANLGATYRLANRFTRAEKSLEQAWQLARSESGQWAAAVGDKALADQLDLHMTFGRQEPIERLLAEAEGRDVQGSAVETLEFARWTVQGLTNAHEKAVPSGPVALDKILRHLGRKDVYDPELASSEEPTEEEDLRKDAAQPLLHNPTLAAFHATPEGASLVEMQALASEVGLKMQMAYREDPDARIPVPSMMHLRSQHFAAVIGVDRDGTVRLNDPILGGDIYLSPRVLKEEASGYFLVRAGDLPKGWRAADPSAAGAVRGKCHYPFLEGGATGQKAPPCKPCQGLAGYTIQLQLAGISIMDTPVGYTPPRGPALDFTVVHNHREIGQPAIFPFSNLGKKATHNWLSYVEDNPSLPSANLLLYLRGGGRESLTGFDGTAFQPHYFSRGVLRRVSSAPIRYERDLPEGGVEVFALSDGALTAPRRIFLTEVRDAQGNVAQLAYDIQLRLVSITDAIGQVTTLTYELLSDPLKITKVTDPFGRSARFEYNDSGQLIRIVDVIGMTSSLEYGVSGYVRALTTPYGTSTFRWGAQVTILGYEPMRWVEATDPLGGTERVEFWMSSTQVPSSDPASLVPTAVTGNSALNQRNSYYWDKRAHMLHPGDQTKAVITHWLQQDIYAIAPVAGWEKKPLENRVWQQQSSAPIPGGIGPTGRPTRVARVLDDGTSQAYLYEYNSKGQITRQTDPLGRETLFEHDSNDIDLLTIKQKNGSNYEVLETRAYNAQHRPLTVTDAAGQTTTYTYNAAGQVLTVTTPPRAGITENRTTTFTYDTNGYLQSTAGPAAGTTTGYTYDGYGRVRTVTDPDNYAVTLDYDALDRQTRITYPDGTYAETIYNRLDAERQRDRFGRWTHTFHDALRRVVATRDPLGRTTTQQWCTCGSLDKLIDSNGNATTWERDLQGRVTREVRADSAAWEYTHENTTSRLKQRKDPKNQVTGYEYFLDGNLKQLTYTNAVVATPSASFTYDPVYNRPASMTDGTGTTGFTYNSIAVPPTLGAGRLASVNGPLANDTVSYTYDEWSRIASRGLSGFISTFTYDVLGRTSALGGPLGNFTYTFDGTTPRPLTLSYPNGQATQYAYFPNSGDHRLQEIKHLAPGGATLSKYNYTYDAESNLKAWTQQVGASAAKVYELGYDAAYQLTAATLKSTDPTPVILKRYGYAYDGVGNRTSEQVDDGVFSATHNSRNQLTSRQAGGALLFRGTVSEPATVTVQGKPAQVAPDNRFEGPAQMTSGTNTVAVVATDPSGNVRTNTYQVSVSGTGASFTYDQNGNLTGDGTKTFEYDAENRLTRVLSGGSEVARFSYDGLSRRTERIAGGVTTTYVYDTESVLEERLSTGGTLRYVDGPLVDQHWAAQDGGGTVSYYLTDHLGSVVQVTNAAGAATLSRDYDPYGNHLSGASQSGNAYTGREWDAAVDLHYYRARYYDARSGRFISEDPIGFAAGVNFYSYVFGNPINLTDPFGLDAYACKIPAKGNANGPHDTRYGPDIYFNPVYHEYLCVVSPNGKSTCGGLRPKTPPTDPFTPVPGEPSEDYFEPKRCDRISNAPNSCYERCVAKRIDKNTPRPSYTLATYNCKDFASEIIWSCMTECFLKGAGK